MASRPPETDDIVVRARPQNRAREIIAFIPRIGVLTSEGGLDYDMALTEEVTHENDVTHHPIEDPQRSFIYDHNRENPTTIHISLIVSSNPLLAGSSSASFRLTGVDRLARFQDKLLAMRAAQSVDTSAYFDVYTGLRVYHNMGFTSVSFKRDPETPNVLTVDMSMVEFRFARPPRAEAKAYLLDANDGPRNSANTALVTDADRPIVESTRVRASPRIAAPSGSLRSVIKASISKLGKRAQLSLGIDITKIIDTADEVGIMLPDGVPSQQYTMKLNGLDTDIQFDFNQIADRWSFSAGLTGASCPLLGGHLVEPGLNLFARLSPTELLLPLDRPGISTAGIDWHTRLTVPLSDGVPSTLLAIGSVAAFTGLFRPRTSLAC